MLSVISLDGGARLFDISLDGEQGSLDWEQGSLASVYMESKALRHQ